MDSLTHMLVGHAMGVMASNVSPAAGPAIYWASLIGNSLPDIDVPISLVLRRDTKMHRTATHTVWGAVGLALLSSVALVWVFPDTPFQTVFAWALVSNLTHLGLDCLNLFGARPLWPLTSRSVDLGLLHILDPQLILLLGAPALAVAVGAAKGGVLAGALLLLPIYVLYRFATARRLLFLLMKRGARKARVIPWFSSWRYVFETAGSIEFGCWRRGHRHVLNHIEKQDSPLIRASLRDPLVISFLRSAEYPYAEVQEDADGAAVVWADVLRQQRADFQPLRIRIG